MPARTAHVSAPCRGRPKKWSSRGISPSGLQHNPLKTCSPRPLVEPRRHPGGRGFNLTRLHVDLGFCKALYVSARRCYQPEDMGNPGSLHLLCFTHNCTERDPSMVQDWQPDIVARLPQTTARQQGAGRRHRSRADAPALIPSVESLSRRLLQVRWPHQRRPVATNSTGLQPQEPQNYPEHGLPSRNAPVPTAIPQEPQLPGHRERRKGQAQLAYRAESCLWTESQLWFRAEHHLRSSHSSSATTVPRFPPPTAQA
jgi:hypothetical protein